MSVKEDHVVAIAMREKRRELIAQPLDRVWLQLAQAAIDAIDRRRAEENE